MPPEAKSGPPASPGSIKRGSCMGRRVWLLLACMSGGAGGGPAELLLQCCVSLPAVRNANHQAALHSFKERLIYPGFIRTLPVSRDIWTQLIQLISIQIVGRGHNNKRTGNGFRPGPSLSHYWPANRGACQNSIHLYRTRRTFIAGRTKRWLLPFPHGRCSRWNSPPWSAETVPAT